MLDYAARTLLFNTLSRVARGSVEVVTPEGRVHRFEGNEPGTHAQVHLHRWSTVYDLVLRADIGFADAYRKGGWDSDDPTALMTFAMENEQALEGYINGGRMIRGLSAIRYALRRDTLHGSRKNIHAHYDLGNAFYSLWLDPSMTYSSALWKSGHESLEQAQQQKYDRILGRFDRPGEMLEIGCGWGGFAERAATTTDHRLKSITISQEQHDFARARLHPHGKQAAVALEDYRLQQGKFDRIVSIEMFEAVGEKFWPVFFDKVKSMLAPGGSAVLQTITIRNDLFETYRTTGDAIRTYIFPGGMLPSEERFRHTAKTHGLETTDTFFFGRDYARTLKEWLDTFERKLPQVRALGFDEGFIRLWKYYLFACSAAFNVGRTDVMQVELRHG